MLVSMVLVLTRMLSWLRQDAGRPQECWFQERHGIADEELPFDAEN